MTNFKTVHPSRQIEVRAMRFAVLFFFSQTGGGELIVLKIESDINILHCRTYYKSSNLLNHFC